MVYTKPATRDAFKAYCLRQLGDGVIDLNMSDAQVEDRIQEALEKYYEFHYKGSFKTYRSHQITADDKTNGYITLPETTLWVSDVLDVGRLYAAQTGMFSLEYQVSLNDLWNITSKSMVPYYMSKYQLENYADMLQAQPRLRYNVHEDKLYLDMNMAELQTGNYIVVVLYEKLDEDVNTDLWADRWLQNYACALLRKQWGWNLLKYDNIQLPGGAIMNGRQIYDEGQGDIDKLEQELQENYTYPPDDFIG